MCTDMHLQCHEIFYCNLYHETKLLIYTFKENHALKISECLKIFINVSDQKVFCLVLIKNYILLQIVFTATG